MPDFRVIYLFSLSNSIYIACLPCSITCILILPSQAWVVSSTLSEPVAATISTSSSPSESREMPLLAACPNLFSLPADPNTPVCVDHTRVLGVTLTQGVRTFLVLQGRIANYATCNGEFLFLVSERVVGGQQSNPRVTFTATYGQGTLSQSSVLWNPPCNNLRTGAGGSWDGTFTINISATRGARFDLGFPCAR